ncbi:MAG: Gfo/Idh/MocA family oxidoreductase [Fimbriimonadales bacterium]|nr:Gfo/Idh/MocA family oxidoreductase [Fimbriimonadales bacterium]
MALRIGFLSVAHMHAYSYAAALLRLGGVEIAGVWDEVSERRTAFAAAFETVGFDSPEALAEASDGVIVTSENLSHIPLIELAAAAGKPVLCEKPLAASETDAARLMAALRSHPFPLMTAFPCRYAAGFRELRSRFESGELGDALAACTTNHGMCPFGWFVDVSKSGGGAMIDHVVHVADLLWVLFGEEPQTVYAQVGNRMYGQAWEDTAMLTLQYPSGRFASLDSSWSRPKSFKTWGDVTIQLVCERGVFELDLFAQELLHYGDEGPSLQARFYGSDMDEGLVRDFVSVVRGEIPSPIPAEDGLRAARVALAGYRSVAEGRPVEP